MNGLLLHLSLDDGELQPPVIRNCYANREVTKCHLLHISMDKNLLLREDVHVVVEGGGIAEGTEVGLCSMAFWWHL